MLNSSKVSLKKLFLKLCMEYDIWAVNMWWKRILRGIQRWCSNRTFSWNLNAYQSNRFCTVEIAVLFHFHAAVWNVYISSNDLKPLHSIQKEIEIKLCSWKIHISRMRITWLKWISLCDLYHDSWFKLIWYSFLINY